MEELWTAVKWVLIISAVGGWILALMWYGTKKLKELIDFLLREE